MKIRTPDLPVMTFKSTRDSLDFIIKSMVDKYGIDLELRVKYTDSNKVYSFSNEDRNTTIKSVHKREKGARYIPDRMITTAISKADSKKMRLERLLTDIVKAVESGNTIRHASLVSQYLKLANIV